jgi:hypothetical protein
LQMVSKDETFAKRLAEARKLAVMLWLQPPRLVMQNWMKNQTRWLCRLSIKNKQEAETIQWDLYTGCKVRRSVPADFPF